MPHSQIIQLGGGVQSADLGSTFVEVQVGLVRQEPEGRERHVGSLTHLSRFPKAF